MHYQFGDKYSKSGAELYLPKSLVLHSGDWSAIRTTEKQTKCHRYASTFSEAVTEELSLLKSYSVLTDFILPPYTEGCYKTQSTDFLSMECSAASHLGMQVKLWTLSPEVNKSGHLAHLSYDKEVSLLTGHKSRERQKV